MAGLKGIIKILEDYQKILKVIVGERNQELDELIFIMKPYKELEVHDLKMKLQGDTSPLKRKVTKKSGTDYLLMSKLYRLKQENQTLKIEEERILESFLTSPKEKVVMAILNAKLNDSYQILLEEKGLTEKQIIFLGEVLFDMQVKGARKEDKRDRLLQLMWKAIENQKMNEIYENGL